MRIGELARRTGVGAHLLRYYEAQELIAPSRGANGYRWSGTWTRPTPPSWPGGSR